MKITITEALRLKNELSTTVNTIRYSISNSLFGDTFENGVNLSQDKDKFIDVEQSLLTALAISEELNNKISEFNKKNKVDQTVRKMQNAKLLLDIYSNNLSKCKYKSTKRIDNSIGGKEVITVEYTPYVSSSEMKEKISVQKNLIRLYQKAIEKANQMTINLDFGYSDIENLIN